MSIKKRTTTLFTVLLVVLVGAFGVLGAGCDWIGGIFGNDGPPALRINNAFTTNIMFEEGDVFDRTSIQVEFASTGNNWRQTTAFLHYPARPLLPTDTQVTITYRDLTVTHTIMVQPRVVLPTPPETPGNGSPTYPGNGGGPVMPSIPVTSITITPPTTATWTVGAIPNSAGRTIGMTFAPSNANTPIEWHSSNSYFATVGNNGVVSLVSLVANGYTDITASSGSVVSNTIRIRVEGAPTNGQVLTALSIPIATTRQWVLDASHNPLSGRRTLPLNRTPATATAVEVTWTSTNTSVATVDAHGDITLVGVGTTFVRAASGTVNSNQVQINVTQNGVAARTGPCNRNRGVGYGFGGGTAVPRLNALTSGENPVSWFYNWANTPPAGIVDPARGAGVRYVPMHWGGTFGDAGMTRIRDWVIEQRALGQEISYLRTLNEVNISGQGAILPANFVSNAWVNLLSIARELDLKIISPTVAHGNVTGTLAGPGGRYAGEMGGPNWIVDFMREIQNRNNPVRYGTIHEIYAVAVNTYTSWASHFSIFAERSRTAVQREFSVDVKIWVTEWASWYYPYRIFNGTQSGAGPELRTREMQRRWQAWHMSQGIAWMEQSPAVTKYAWYHVSRADYSPSINLMTGTTLTEIGVVYTNASVFDSNYWIDISQGRIGAATMVTRNNISMWVNNPLNAGLNERPAVAGNGFRESVNFWPTRDTAPDAFAIDLNDLGRYTGGGGNNKWIEYQIYVPANMAGNFRLDVRNQTPATSNVTINIDGRTITHAFTGAAAWRTTGINIGHLSAGSHTIRLTGTTDLRGSGWPPSRSNYEGNLSLNWIEFVSI